MEIMGGMGFMGFWRAAILCRRTRAQEIAPPPEHAGARDCAPPELLYWGLLGTLRGGVWTLASFWVFEKQACCVCEMDACRVALAAGHGFACIDDR